MYIYNMVYITYKYTYYTYDEYLYASSLYFSHIASSLWTSLVKALVPLTLPIPFFVLGEGQLWVWSLILSLATCFFVLSAYFSRFLSYVEVPTSLSWSTGALRVSWLVDNCEEDIIAFLSRGYSAKDIAHLPLMSR